MGTTYRTRGWWLTVGMALLLGGCDKLTRTHYDLIVQEVSTTEDVRHAIGKPDYTLDQQWHYERPHEHLNVIVDYSPAGVVTRKQWIDAEAGVWDDTQNPAEDSP